MTKHTNVTFWFKFTDSEILTEKEHVQIVAIQDSEIIATAVLVPEGNCCKMQRVVVKEELVNRGIGSKLMMFCEAYAQKTRFCIYLLSCA